ncbi:MAG: hypothetical protein R3E88_22370 [Myxococcota bacterium]
MRPDGPPAPSEAPRARGAGALVAAAVAVATGLVACAIATSQGPFGATVGGADLYAMYLAKHDLIAATWRAGRLPLWNPYEFAGLPLHGTSQGSALYPPVVVPNLFLDRESALQVAFWLHVVGFCVGLVAYLRAQGIALAAAAVGAFLGIAWFFESAGGAATNQAHYCFEIAWVPAILLAWHRFAGGSARAGVALPLLVAAQWLPGYPEFPMDTAVLLGIVALATPGPPLARRAAWVVGLVALGALVAAVQLVPLAEATRESIRIDWAREGFDPILSGFAIGLANLDDRALGLFGAAGLALVAVGARVARGAERGWLAAFLVAFFAATWPLSLMYEVYPYRLFRFAWGWVHMAPVFGACLAALALDRLAFARRDGARPARFAIAAALAVAAAAAAYGRAFDAGIALAAAVALAVGVAAPARMSRFVGPRAPLAAAALVGLLAVAPVAFGLRDLTVRRAQRAPDLEAQAARAALLRELRASLPNDPRVFGETELRAGSFVADRLPSPLGHEAAVPPRRVAELVRSVGMWAVFNHFEERARLWNGMADAPGVMASLGIGIVTGTPREVRPLLAAGYRVVGRFADGGVAVYREPVPRAAVHHRIVRARDEAESLALATAPGFDPFREAIALSDAPIEAEPAPPGAREEARVVVDEPERVVVRATLASPGLLVLRDAQYPGWSVRVDGAPRAGATANHALRAVALAAGEHEVEWRYRPASVALGAALSALGLALVAAVGVALARGVVRGA